MASTLNIRKLRWAKGVTPGAPPDVLDDPNIKEANSQTFVAGDLVTVTPGTGTVAEFAANGRHLAGIALDSATNASGSTNQKIRIQIIQPNETYIATLRSSSTTVASAITHLGKCYGLISPSAGVWCADANSATVTNANVQVTGFVYGPDVDSSGNPCVKALGDTNAEVYVKFMTGDGTNAQILDFGGC